MKTLKEGLFWFVMFYVVIVSFLFIRQAFIVHDTMYKPIYLEPNEKYETFITESRAKLANYRTLATTDEQLACLNEVEKAIDISYQNQHAPIANYKEAQLYYYENYGAVISWDKLKGVSNFCKTSEAETDEYKELTLKYIMTNVVIIESKLIETNTIFVVSIPSVTSWIINNVASPTVDKLAKQYEQDIRSLVINNDIDYINSILNLVGENYE